MKGNFTKNLNEGEITKYFFTILCIYIKDLHGGAKIKKIQLICSNKADYKKTILLYNRAMVPGPDLYDLYQLLP